MRDLLNCFDLTLATVVGSGNSVARQVAIKLVSRLAARGMPDYQDLIQDSEPEASIIANRLELVSRHPQFVSRSAKNTLLERRFTNDGLLITPMCPPNPHSFFVVQAARKHLPRVISTGALEMRTQGTPVRIESSALVPPV
jgi:hypothetical protein